MQYGEGVNMTLKGMVTAILGEARATKGKIENGALTAPQSSAHLSALSWLGRLQTSTLERLVLLTVG